MTKPQRTEETNLARQVEAAQSILTLPLAGEAIRFERAAAACSAEVAVAMARLDPSSGPKPFRGPGDLLARLFVEQWVTFPRYVLSGGFGRAWRASSAEPAKAGQHRS